MTIIGSLIFSEIDERALTPYVVRVSLANHISLMNHTPYCCFLGQIAITAVAAAECSFAVVSNDSSS